MMGEESVMAAVTEPVLHVRHGVAGTHGPPPTLADDAAADTINGGEKEEEVEAILPENAAANDGALLGMTEDAGVLPHLPPLIPLKNHRFHQNGATFPLPTTTAAEEGNRRAAKANTMTPAEIPRHKSQREPRNDPRNKLKEMMAKRGKGMMKAWRKDRNCHWLRQSKSLLHHHPPMALPSPLQLPHHHQIRTRRCASTPR
jgi:hypothetical protein